MQGMINLTRWIFSILLLLAAIIHIDIFSLIYILLFLAIPWTLIHSTIIRWRLFFIFSFIALIISLAFLLITTSLHLLFITKTGSSIFNMDCSSNVRILHHLGLMLWTHTTNKTLFIVMIIVHVMIAGCSLFTLIIHNRMRISRDYQRRSMIEETIVNHSILSDHFQSIPLRIRPIFVYSRSILLLILIHTCGSLLPSLICAFYFLVSLGLALWWALGKHFGYAYLLIIRLLQIYSLTHFILFYLYQFPFFSQIVLKSESSLVGLRILRQIPCFTHSNDHHWIVYIQPLIILILYWIATSEHHLSWKYHQSYLLRNNSQHSSSSAISHPDTFHLQSITDLFWLEPSTEIYPNRPLTNSLLLAFISFILTKAYMLSMIAMLLWSITYHSYLTLPYLILACFIWLVPRSQYWCHVTSPIFSGYALILLIINYIHLLNFLDQDFSWRIHEIEFLHAKSEQFNQPSWKIYFKCSVKFLYTLFLLLSLRQRMREQNRQYDGNFYEHIQLIPPVPPSMKSPSTSYLHRIRAYFIAQCSTIYYEIYSIIYMGYANIWFYNLFFNWSRLLTILLIFILSYGSGSTPVAYRIIYMAFFLHYHLCYAFNQSLWNIYLFPFYISLILYSMFVLFLIYIYQFEQFKSFKTRLCFAHIQCEIFLSSLGIRHADQHILGMELFTPTAFLICIVMHIHFFHRQEKKSRFHSHSNRQMHSSIQIFTWLQRLKKYYHIVENLLWSLGELLSYKLLLLIICFCFTKQTNISPMNFCVMLVFVLGLMFPSVQIFALGLYALTSAMHILMIMIVRLELFTIVGYVKNVCANSNSSQSDENHYFSDLNPSLSTRLIAPLQWFGLWTTHPSDITLGQLITPCLFDFTENSMKKILLVLDLAVVLGVAALQLVRRHHKGKTLSLNDLFHSTHFRLFTDIDIHSIHDSIYHTLKYLANYGTYRFGLELSLFASLCLIILRMDAIAVSHAMILFICILLPRVYVRRFWKCYRIFASICAVWLYLNALGLPPVLCLKHLFDRSILTWFPQEIWFQFKVYLYLSDYFEWRPLSEHLLPDFLLLIILTMQEINFTFEQQQIHVQIMGTNDDEDSSPYRPNLLHDFITNHSLSWSDRFSSFFYSYVYWFILIVLYIIVVYHQSSLYLLILLACFFLLWHGQTFLQRSFYRQKSFWRLLILAFFFLFLAHLLIQPLSCVFIQYASVQYRCILINLFNVPCSIKSFRRIYTKDCSDQSGWISREEIRDVCEGNSYNHSQTIEQTQRMFYCSSKLNYLIMDAIAFLFVLLFIRLLDSYAFFYVRLELQIQDELSQIGASLLSQLNWLKLMEYRQRTDQELESIKTRVTQIRQRRTMQKREADIDEPIYHYPAIHSGDYYMFDYPLDSSNTLLNTKHHSSASGNSMDFFDIFDWKVYDVETSDESPLTNENKKQWNNSIWDEELIENRTLQQSWNATGVKTEEQRIPTRIDLASFLTFSELKRHSDKIRRTLDAMNSHLIIYFGHHVRTLLLISQVISDAKLYLKYPSETAHLITNVIPENINDSVNQVCEHPSPNRQVNTTTDLREDELKPMYSISSHLRLWTWFRSNVKSTFSDCREQINGSTSTARSKMPQMIDQHLGKLQASRLHIGPGTILSSFLISKFDYLTYLTLILNFLASGAALIWLLLLASIYFWAILTFPYPSRRFWHVITLTSMFILFIQYNITFIPSLSSNRYIRYSLIGDLNLIANVLLLSVLSFHRIVLHQLGLWDDFHIPTEDLSIYQTKFTPSNTKHFRHEIIRAIYSMLKKEIAHDQNLPTRNSNAIEEKDEMTHSPSIIPAPSMASILPDAIVDQIEFNADIPVEQNPVSPPTRSYWQKCRDLFQTIRQFYSFAIACPIVPKVDYYSSMFLCDFIVIFFIIAGHQRFSHSNTVKDNIIYRYIQGSSSLDITPILMLVAQFVLIIVDRMIYLKKNVQGKFLFLCFQFLVLHLWLVIVYPIWFQHGMSSNWAAMSIYILKSFYFMLSALQIRNGYPSRILGNFLTKRYSVLRLLCYRLYCTIPFLYEMRVLMDWMFIPTSLSLTYYFMMEEIARNAWTQKCWRVTEARAPTKRAQNRGRCERYCVGGWILFAIIFVIWFPLVFFSISTTLADPIPIDRCEIKLRLSTYKELYQLVTTNVREPNEKEFASDIQPLILNSSFASGPRDFNEADVACIQALGNVGPQWSISFSAVDQMEEELRKYIHDPKALIPQIYFDYFLTRKGQTSEQDVLPSGYTVTLSGTHNSSLTRENAMALLTMLDSDNQTRMTIVVSKLMPKFIHLLPDMIDVKSSTFPQDIQLTLRREEQLLWWDIIEVPNPDWKSKCSFNPQALNLLTVSERSGAQSKSFNLISKLLLGSSAKLTLIGVYAGLVYVLWLTCFRQTLFSDIQLIMYHEWPFADRVAKLCEEVYLVRELGELQLEEELFARILFLHRSPETLIRLTRPKAKLKHHEH